ncbi:MAG TPA: TadE/TadG family type IV pilus assembly protein [Thermomicrobiaceae bacterium]|nr:TadE/TadG family type IV pilus assembly protein [Thermomicrobiaceae bacterium]
MPRDEAFNGTCDRSDLSQDGVTGTSRRRSRRRRGFAAQAVVEFAIGSIVFFGVILGTIDYGRVIFMYSELQNAVREGARYAEVQPTDTTGIQNYVVTKAPQLGLTTSSVTVTCSPSCTTGGSVTVVATLQFQAFTQKLLHIGALTLNASATNAIE